MIPPSNDQKLYSPARRRFLQDSIESFFESEFPKLFGPIMRRRLSEALLHLIEQQLPAREFLRPGQCLWNALSADSRPGSSKSRPVPVVLTLIDPDDIEDLVAGKKMSEIARQAVARITREAYEQGALLSMRDIGLLVWRTNGTISTIRKKWETAHDQLLPHPGNLHDFGSCISHKTTIVTKTVKEGKDPRRVARETGHSQVAVDRYLRDYHRVRTAYEHHPDLDFVCHTTGLSKHLVKQYVRMIDEDAKTS